MYSNAMERLLVMQVRKLEIGAGCEQGAQKAGYEHNELNPGPDVEFVGPAQELEFPDNTWDEIFGTGIFEHFTYEEAVLFLHKAIRWLKPGGVLDINAPDISKWIVHLAKQDRDPQWIAACFHGWQRFPDDEHKSWWSRDMMENVLTAVGFVSLDVYQLWAYQGPDDWHICIKGYKPD